MKKSIIFIALIALFATSACGGKPLSEEQMIYAGTWGAADGSLIQIFENGKANMQYRNDGANTSVQGGTVTIEDGVLEIGLFGIGHEFQIDQEPVERNRRWFMVLDGIEYSKR